MCSGVPELRLSSAEANARLRRIVFEVNSIYSTLRSQRPRCMRPFPQRLPPPSFLFTASLLPTHRRVSGAVVGLLPTTATQQPPPFSLLVTGHHTPLPRFSVWHPLRLNARALMQSVVLASMLRRRNEVILDEGPLIAGLHCQQERKWEGASLGKEDIGITEEMLRKVLGIGMEFFKLPPEEKF
uniref:Uncharacterized protein n=1 Tax=Oryza rufipogon TaxID=4529 RepID=A0A0E0PEV3_ORYRU